MIELKLKRKLYSDKQTVGVMDVYKNSVFQFSLAILEKQWNNNKIGNSCIPKGSYIVEHYSSQKHPAVFIIKDTEPRTSILLHIGNYYEHSQGCLLVGLTHSYINDDNYIDVKYSTEGMDKLTDICKHETIILIDII